MISFTLSRCEIGGTFSTSGSVNWSSPSFAYFSSRSPLSPLSLRMLSLADFRSAPRDWAAVGIGEFWRMLGSHQKIDRSICSILGHMNVVNMKVGVVTRIKVEYLLQF